MSIKLQRGRVGNITRSAKDRSVDCPIGNMQVTAHPNLAKAFASGDEVMVAGEVKNDVLHAFALRNLTQDKSAQIDCTNYILILGMGGYVGILCGVFGLEAVGTGSLLGMVQDAASIAGLMVAGWAVHRLLLVIKANRWLKYAQIAEQAANGTP